MIYNGETNGLDIVTMSEKLSKQNSVSFPIAEKTLYANQAVKIIQGWIYDAYGGWLYDDSNNTDFPEATTTLTANQVDYALPTDANKLIGVSIKDTGGAWKKLKPITLEQIQDVGWSESEFLKTASQPMYYRPIGKSIKLYPASNYTQAASLKVYESRETTLFAVTDTTKTPGFDAQYHEGVPIFMALQFATVNTLPQAGGVMRGGFKTGLNAMWSDFEQRLKKDYSQRFAELFPPRLTVSDRTQDYL